MINPWSNDECNFKMRMLTKKSEVLTVCWPQLTFWPIQLIFNHLSNCLRKLDLWSLKLDMENLWSIWGTMKTIGGVRSPSGSEECQTLVWVDCLGGSLSDQLLRNPWVWMYRIFGEDGGKILGYDSVHCVCLPVPWWRAQEEAMCSNWWQTRNWTVIKTHK